MYEQLIAYCESQGVVVRETPRLRYVGIWDAEHRIIWLNSRLTGRERVPVLLHEVLHMQAGHIGPQPAAVERRIRRDVARILISRNAYARAEKLADGDLFGIAEELDAPAWLIRDYQQILECTPQGVSDLS